MANHSIVENPFGYEVEEEYPFAFPSHFPSFDFCGDAYNWHNELSIQDPFPLMESLSPCDSLYSCLDIQQSPTIIEDDVNVWNELGSLFEPQNDKSNTKELKEEKNARNCTQEKMNNSTIISKALTREKISNYFYMPIIQAAKELNVGITLLKKRCRELGIRRWPHRKLTSLQSLIKNVQEIKKVDGEESEEKLKEEIEMLKREMKLLEEMPDVQLEHKTMSLRQACFKANFKKRKMMAMNNNNNNNNNNISSSSSGGSSHASLVAHEMMMDEDDEEIKSLLNQPFCHDNNLMF